MEIVYALERYKYNEFYISNNAACMCAETLVRLSRICPSMKLNKWPLPLSEWIFIKAVIYFLCTGLDT